MPIGDETNVVRLRKQKTQELIGFSFPSPKKWYALLQRANKIAPRSRAHYIALGDWFNSQEGVKNHAGDLNKFKAYKIFKKAIEEYGKDPILISGVTINAFSIYAQHFARNWFINDLIGYGNDYFELKREKWGDLFYLADGLSDLEIYLDKDKLFDKWQRILLFDLEVREKMFELQPEDASNLCHLAYDCQCLDLPLKVKKYYSNAIEFSRQGKLKEFGIFGDVEHISPSEIKERLQIYLGRT